MARLQADSVSRPDGQPAKRPNVPVNAGHPTEVHPKTLEAINEQLAVDVDGQSDILLAGISDPKNATPSSR